MECLLRRAKPLFLALASLVAACVPLPPPALPPAGELPKVEADGCEVYVARLGRYFVGSIASTHVIVNSGLVASLKGNQYTMLRLPPGQHTVGIVWRYWGFAACSPVNCAGSPPSKLDDKVEIDCQPGKKLRLGIERSSLSGGPGGTVAFLIRDSTAADADFDLTGKSFVAPRGAEE